MRQQDTTWNLYMSIFRWKRKRGLLLCIRCHSHECMLQGLQEGYKQEVKLRRVASGVRGFAVKIVVPNCMMALVHLAAFFYGNFPAWCQNHPTGDPNNIAMSLYQFSLSVVCNQLSDHLNLHTQKCSRNTTHNTLTDAQNVL